MILFQVRRLLKISKESEKEVNLLTHYLNFLGAEVIYKAPEWVEKKKEEALKAEKEIKEAGFEYPVKRYEGMGQDKVRKRRPRLQRYIDYGFGQPGAASAEK